MTYTPTRYQFVCLDGADDWGIYHKHRTGPFGTPLVFRGTLEQCRKFAKENL